jgi:hypothetical protein
MVKGGPSGWDKRKCTLQTTLHADGLPHTKPLLMFAGAEGLGNRSRQEEVKRYHKGVDVIFNPKAYCNSKAMVGWLKNQFRWGTPYPLSDHEPRLLVLDSFAPHKNQGSKKQPITLAAIAKAKAEEELRQQIRDELKNLNTTVSIIPGGCTSLLQPCDLTANSILKVLIKEYEEDHIDNNFEDWKAGRYNVSERRVLMTQWVGRAWEALHKHHKDAIIRTFRQTAIALPPDGSCDTEIKIRGLPGLQIGDYSREAIEIDGKEIISTSTLFANN